MYAETRYSSFFAALDARRRLQMRCGNVAIVETTIYRPNGRNVRSCRLFTSQDHGLVRAGVAAWLFAQRQRGLTAHEIR